MNIRCSNCGNIAEFVVDGNSLCENCLPKSTKLKIRSGTVNKNLIDESISDVSGEMLDNE